MYRVGYPGLHLTVPLMTGDYDAIDKLHDLVSNNGHRHHDIAAVNVRAMALISRLKALNRDANAATRVAKEATAQSRLDMDQSHLGLQNLLYEKRHLEREIEKCRQFALVSPLRLPFLSNASQFHLSGRPTL